MSRLQRLSKKTVSPASMARSLGIPLDAVLNLCRAGYLCTVKSRSGMGFRIVRSFPLDKLPPWIVDRMSVVLWMIGLDDHARMPMFNKRIEMEIMRIARLPDPARTEQAVRLVLRYRDAEEVAKAILKARDGDVIQADMEQKAYRYKYRIAALATAQERVRPPKPPK